MGIWPSIILETKTWSDVNQSASIWDKLSLCPSRTMEVDDFVQGGAGANPGWGAGHDMVRWVTFVQQVPWESHAL